ncbi:MAG: cyclic nucleotide-binding domain-containing protein [Methylococcaceae bacterium]|nr:cyclic nucleotide-binding domain-containing protein [Methylococcaceae bacterium]
MLLDCPPYLEYALKARGISRNQVKSIFLSHIHDDHCNIFPLVMFHERLKFLCTKEIFWMACKKLSLMTMHDTEEFTSYFDFQELIPNEANDFYGMKITPHYTVHSIPCIGATFEMKCDGHNKSIVFVGDNKALPEIEKMVETGSVTKEKYQNIQRLYYERFDIFAADGGMGILHGDPQDSIKSQSDLIVFMHLENLPDKFNASFTMASPGKRFILKEGSEVGQVIKTMHLLNHLYPKISEQWQNSLLNNIEITKYNAGDVIIKQGDTTKLDAFIILSGNVCVLYHDGKKFNDLAIHQAGDIIGEMAVLNNFRKRRASIIAESPVMLGRVDGEILYAFLKHEGRIEANLKMLTIRTKLEQLFRTFGLSVIVNQQIASVATLIPVENDQVIIKQNDTDQEFYIILEGKFLVTKDGKERAILREREVFGEFGGLMNQPRNATVTSLGAGELIQLKKEDFVHFAKEIPSFNYYLNQLMRDRNELASIINMPMHFPTK